MTVFDADTKRKRKSDDYRDVFSIKHKQPKVISPYQGNKQKEGKQNSTRYATPETITPKQKISEAELNVEPFILAGGDYRTSKESSFSKQFSSIEDISVVDRVCLDNAFCYNALGDSVSPFYGFHGLQAGDTSFNEHSSMFEIQPVASCENLVPSFECMKKDINNKPSSCSSTAKKSAFKSLNIPKSGPEIFNVLDSTLQGISNSMVVASEGPPFTLKSVCNHTAKKMEFVLGKENLAGLSYCVLCGLTSVITSNAVVCSENECQRVFCHTCLAGRDAFDFSTRRCMVCVYQSEKRPSHNHRSWHWEFKDQMDSRFTHLLRDSLPAAQGLFSEISPARTACWRKKIGNKRKHFSFKFYNGIFEARLEALRFESVAHPLVPSLTPKTLQPKLSRLIQSAVCPNVHPIVRQRICSTISTTQFLSQHTSIRGPPLFQHVRINNHLSSLHPVINNCHLRSLQSAKPSYQYLPPIYPLSNSNDYMSKNIFSLANNQKRSKIYKGLPISELKEDPRLLRYQPINVDGFAASAVGEPLSYDYSTEKDCMSHSI